MFTHHPIRRAFAPLLLLALAAATAAAQTTTRVSVGPAGLEGDDASFYPSALSDDGNVIAFSSAANNFVSGDVPDTLDVFVRDIAADTLECVSLSTTGSPGANYCVDVCLSGDGRYVAFRSGSSNLVPNDTNAVDDVFWFDRVTRTMKRVSVDSSGNEGALGGYEVRISKDGQLVLFTSGSSNLVPNDSNGVNDAFLHDVTTGITERVSLNSSGWEGDDHSFPGGISDDNRYVAISTFAELDPADGNDGSDIYVKDRQTGAITLLTFDPSGNPANGDSYYVTISGDGRFVAYVSSADNLVPFDRNGELDVFVHNLTTGITTRESRSSDGTRTGSDCRYPKLSADGRYVAFSSRSDLTPDPAAGQEQTVFLRDRTLAWTMTPAADSSGVPSKGTSDDIALSRDGRFCTFWNTLDDVDPADHNGVTDVFRHETGLTPATSTNFGLGLAGTLGVPALTSTLPQLHRDCTLTIGNSLGATTFAILFLGDANGTVPTNLGASILLLPSVLVPLSLPAGGLLVVAPIPADEFLIGVPLALQALELDPGAIHDVSFTPRLDLAFGR